MDGSERSEDQSEELGRLRAELRWLRTRAAQGEREPSSGTTNGAGDSLRARLAAGERLLDEARSREQRLATELDRHTTLAAEHHDESRALKLERARSERLRERWQRQGEQLAERDRSLQGSDRTRPLASGRTVGGRAHEELVGELVAEEAVLPSRCEALSRSGSLAYALDEPPVPSIPLVAGPIAQPGLRVASVLDEFSRLGFTYEAALTDLDPERWREQIELARPHLLLVESAWRGTAARWDKKVSHTRSPEVGRLVAFCKKEGIPTVFWNKEDPVNFDRFSHNAPLFDFVFTSDAGSIPRYRELLRHDRIDVLPFAAQPRIHNPVRVPGGRTRSVAFAGTYYRDKHPDRKLQMEAVLDPARAFGLEIFTREPGLDRFRFPDEYQPHVVGSLPYPDLLTAHKMYRAFVNVNSVSTSESMCARRIFELLASGTSVVSGVSAAIEALLGPGLVWQSAGPATTVETLQQIAADPVERDRHALPGLRAVLAAHTYGHRMASIGNAIGLSLDEPDRSLTVVAALEEAGDVARLRANLERQTRRPEQVVLVVRDLAAPVSQLGSVAPKTDIVRIGADSPLGPGLGEALRRATGTFVAFLEPGEFYGPAFLEDLVNAFLYTDADLVGKAATAEHDGRALRPAAGGEREYDEVAALHPATVVARRARISEVPWRAVSDGALALFLRDCRRAGLTLFSADRFNFVGAQRDGLRRPPEPDLSRFEATDAIVA